MITEDEIAQVVSRVMERDNHALALATARQILALVQPAIDAAVAAEREISAALHKAIERENSAYEALRVSAEAGLAAEARVNALTDALEPFARAAGYHALQSVTDDAQVIVEVKPGLSGALTVGDFRRAAAIRKG